MYAITCALCGWHASRRDASKKHVQRARCCCQLRPSCQLTPAHQPFPVSWVCWCGLCAAEMLGFRSWPLNHRMMNDMCLCEKISNFAGRVFG